MESRQNRDYENTGARDQAYTNYLENLYQIEQIKKEYEGEFSVEGPYFDWSIETWEKRNNLQVNRFFDELKKETEDGTSNIKYIEKGDLQEKKDEKFSWRDHNAVNAVQDQGQCGSCWAFSTIANIEGAFAKSHKKLLKLSESELVDCMQFDKGCNGGLPWFTVEELIKKKEGLDSEREYPYKAMQGRCQYDAAGAMVFVHDERAVREGDETEMLKTLLTYGPLSVGVNANPLMHYRGGVLDPKAGACPGSGINHAVTVTGYGHEDGKDYWEVRNSWGPGWGKGGYFHIRRGTNACGIARMATTVTSVNSKAASSFRKSMTE